MDYVVSGIPPVFFFFLNYFLVKRWTRKNLDKAVADVAERHALWHNYGSSYDENIQNLIENRIYSQDLEGRALRKVTKELRGKLDLEQYDRDLLGAVAQEVVHIINQNQLRKPNE